eukprot:TRINITY_DN7663_c0_g1_i1.p1 TRINITY_DN7663_c0_g1~~TRINITY_DN7663_c0_g1_i1.p1  ORF type:complete len:588 (-),score=105.66 TRINITY_DN7663_c0_g1_i1:854-2617(-)
MATEGKTVDVHIFHFNDVYRLTEAEVEPVGGPARFANALKRLRKKYEESLLFFSGDAFNPSIMSTITRGKHMVPILNALNISAAVYGNHDFDFGIETLKQLTKESTYPWLLSNVDSLNKSPLAAGLRYVVLPYANLKIGVIGLAEKEWLQTVPDMASMEVKYTSFVTKAQKLGKKLRQDKGVDIVIALVHMRMHNSLRLAEEASEVDLVLAGHDHFYATNEAPNGTKVIVSGSDFKYISDIKLSFNTETKAVNVTSKKITITKLELEDSEITKLVKEIRGDIDRKMDRVIGYFGVPFDTISKHIRTRETNSANFVADVARTAMNTDLALVNCGTIRSDNMYVPSKITMGTFMSIFPFLDVIVVIAVTGQSLLSALENAVSMVPATEGRFPAISGMKVRFDSSKPPGKRVLSVEIGEPEKGYKPLELEKKYSLATKDYIARGNDGYDMCKSCERLVTTENGKNLQTLLRTRICQIDALNGIRIKTSVKSASERHPREESCCDGAARLTVPASTNNPLRTPKFRMWGSPKHGYRFSLRPKVDGRLIDVASQAYAALTARRKLYDAYSKEQLIARILELESAAKAAKKSS